MRFTSIVVGAVLSLTVSAAPVPKPWAQAYNGVWVANDTRYTIGNLNVHEACTYMNSNNVHNEADGCAFVEWGTGITRNGVCHYSSSNVLDCRT